MTKADLADTVFEKKGLSKKDAMYVVETLFDTMKAILSEGESIKVAGLGTFLVRKKGARRGRNPKTGAELQITPRRVVTFRPSIQFKTAVAKG